MTHPKHVIKESEINYARPWNVVVKLLSLSQIVGGYKFPESRTPCNDIKCSLSDTYRWAENNTQACAVVNSKFSSTFFRLGWTPFDA